ncbi:MFS general substrate transporter [Aspergillus vadensis CBS 113365]|uniref:MFS general substrate transporter n=1 Tax=Aspergillus vadensis (strain CBS 113365 / IMI 142717 / IBT 24658) TaxID=1448311 RepID=A0A319BGB4_ASPVC|nr:MFS general substrate transporter [Aspergillus vadensis CBS 113365]PYH71114.1 MFS general substrate transporter [Aspergillus vadensis CBS 113365]
MDGGDSNDSALSLLDEKREKHLIRKIDLHIIPFVVLLYLFSFLDRVNIGNARLYGMEEDLGLVGDQYQIAVSILFVTYCLFEVPSNLVIKKLRPSRYIASISVMWGIIATLTGITQNYGGLIACRILLGVVEAGLFPGMVTYLTIFYSKREIALRTGYLFSSAAAAGAFGGLLAYGIGFMDGVAGLRGWRWIMIIEGIPTVILGGLSWFFLADDLDTAYYLDEEEKALVVQLRRRDVGQTSSAQRFHWADVKEGALDWRIYAFCIAQFGVDTMLYGYSTFLPTIIQGMGSWTTPEVQALTIPCYAVGAISYLIIAWASDRTQRRGVFTCIFAAISVVGYGILISDSSSGVHYFGALLIALGLYVAVGLPLAWLPTTLPRYGKRTFATGLQLTFGNVSGVMSPFLYKTNEAPRYVRGNAVTLSLVGFAGVVYGLMWWYYHGKNKRREQGLEDEKIAGMSEEEIEEMGDRNPRFRYTFSASWRAWFQSPCIEQHDDWNKSAGDDESQGVDVPYSCTGDQIQMMSRHAARYPTRSAGSRHLALLDRIHKAGTPLNGSLSFLNNWTYITSNTERDFEQLSTTVRFAARYEHLIPSGAKTKLWASEPDRVIETAQHFASGLFGSDWEKTFDHSADTLKPGDTCLNYLEDEARGHYNGIKMLTLFQQAYIPSIAERLLVEKGNRELEGLTNYEVFSMQEIPWCEVFSREDWKNFEYGLDLVHYYRDDPGNPYAGAMGWLWLNATANLLREGPKRMQCSSVCDVHDGDIAPFLTALDIMKDAKYNPFLPVTHRAEDRVWYTSTVMPMGGRVTLERMTCSPTDPVNNMNETFVRMNINDKVVSLPYCKFGPGLSCPFMEFVGEFGDGLFDIVARILHHCVLFPNHFNPILTHHLSSESRNPRRPPEESGPFGKRRNARYEHTRSRTRTGTPAAKRENPNVAEFGRLFAQQQEEEKARSNTLPKSSSASNLDNARKQQTEKVATECILYGYKSKDFEWKVIDKYERISRGFICEDYPRTDPNALNGYSQLLSGGDVVIRANLSADANRKSKRYAGGFHWIKVTFDSTTAADRACFYSPQEIDGHLVFCELYHGQGPAEDAPIVQGSTEATRLQSKAAPRTLTSSHSTSFLQPKDTATKERHTLPRSFASNNLSSILDAHEEESQESSSTPTASSATATAIEQPAPLQQRTVVKEPKPESDFMTHIPTVRRTKLRPITEALPPQPTVTERVLRSIPILSWFTGDIVGDGPQLREDGAFDFDKSNTYWKFWYMVDRVLGTDICGLKEES